MCRQPRLSNATILNCRRPLWRRNSNHTASGKPGAVQNVRWEDVGGLGGIKTALQEAIAWPLSQPAVFERAGVRPPRGILLYGPPGNGKTLIVKALASQSNIN